MQLSAVSKATLTTKKSDIWASTACQIPSNRAGFLIRPVNLVGRKLLQCLPWFDECGVVVTAKLGGDDSSLDDDDDDSLEIPDPPKQSPCSPQAAALSGTMYSPQPPLQAQMVPLSICVKDLCFTFYIQSGVIGQRILRAGQIL